MFRVLGAFRYLVLRLLQCSWPSFGYVGTPLYLRRAGRLNLGKNVRIFPGARIEVEPGAELVIGENTSIGQRAHLFASKNIVIGSGCLLAENVFISDVDHTWSMPGLPIHQQPNKQSDTEIGKNCFLGYGCVILAGTKLGEGLIVGASSVVRGEYDCGSIVAGSPAKIIKLRDGYSSKER